MSTTLQQVPTDTYALDHVHSTIGFGVKYNKLATFRSTFDKFDAQLADGVLTGSADASSVVTFRSTDVRAAEDGSVEVDGDLTIRGITKPVTAKGTYATGGDAFGNERVAFELQTTVDRRDFGIVWQNQLPDGSDALAHDVTISADLQLVKQA